MRLFADSNIVAQAVRALRAAGHDVIYSAERQSDPGDQALLLEALDGQRVFVTKDHDIGTLVHRDRSAHAGVLLIDDLGDPVGEAQMVLSAIADQAGALSAGAFIRVRKPEIKSLGDEV